MLLLIFIAGLLIYGYFYHMSGQPSHTAFKTSVHVNASDLITLSDEDEAMFNRKYLYKILSVRGIIRKVKISRGAVTVMLGGLPALPEVVSCSLDTLYDPPSDLRAGDSCTIQGSCAGCLKDIILLQCIVEK
jgi:hypothetical protein